jgi:hypothetical protein
MPPFVRFLVSLLISLPGRLAWLAGWAFALYWALNMIYGIHPRAPTRLVQFAISLGIALTGCIMVMFAAVLKRKPDEPLTARQTAALAALAMCNEALVEISALLLIGTAYCFFSDHRTAALQLGLFLLAAIAAHWAVSRLENRVDRDWSPEPEIPPRDP